MLTNVLIKKAPQTKYIIIQKHHKIYILAYGNVRIRKVIEDTVHVMHIITYSVFILWFHITMLPEAGTFQSMKSTDCTLNIDILKPQTLA